MKAAEEYIKKYYPYNEEMDDEEILQLKFMIEVAQKEAYNQALDDAVETASCEYKKDYLTGEIDKESILKLKK